MNRKIIGTITDCKSFQSIAIRNKSFSKLVLLTVSSSISPLLANWYKPTPRSERNAAFLMTSQILNHSWKFHRLKFKYLPSLASGVFKSDLWRRRSWGLGVGSVATDAILCPRGKIIFVGLNLNDFHHTNPHLPSPTRLLQTFQSSKTVGKNYVSAWQYGMI